MHWRSFDGLSSNFRIGSGGEFGGVGGILHLKGTLLYSKGHFHIIVQAWEKSTLKLDFYVTPMPPVFTPEFKADVTRDDFQRRFAMRANEVARDFIG
jgi:hypothetical protein